jgi:hypothetical protein
MNPFVVLAATVVVAGAAVAVAGRDARVSGLGLAVILVGSPFVLAPPPSLTGMAFRVGAGILAAFILQLAARRVPAIVGTPLGLRSTAAGAGAAFIAGLGVTPIVLQRSGPEAGLAAGLALVALAVTPVSLGHTPFRVGSGLLVAATGALVLRAALAGPPTAFGELAEGVFIIALAVAVAVVAGAMAPSGAAAGDADTSIEADLAGGAMARSLVRRARRMAADASRPAEATEAMDPR